MSRSIVSFASVSSEVEVSSLGASSALFDADVIVLASRTVLAGIGGILPMLRQNARNTCFSVPERG